MKEKSPILFLVFNRYHNASKCFEMIRNEKPNKLYIAADGPRDNFEEDFKKCDNIILNLGCVAQR